MSCYCISHKDVKSETDEPSSSMDLDAALHEQAMLLQITASQKSNLEKKAKKQRSSTSLSSAPLCVVQMNSKFITQFSLSSNPRRCRLPCDMKEKTAGAADAGVDKLPRDTAIVRKYPRMMSHIFRRRLSKDKPYDSVVRKRKAPRSCIPVVEERASPPAVSRQDSGNKSNPSSPVKSQNSLPPSGSSIVRSRSLDDLEIAKGEDCKDCYARADIDTVSQRISKLHVS